MFVRWGCCAIGWTLVAAAAAPAEVVREKVSGAQGYVVVEVLDDDLVHFEIAAVGDGPAVSEPIYTSPMVQRTAWEGPSAVTVSGTTVETSELRIEVDENDLCIRVEDLARGVYLTTICPVDLTRAWKGIDIDPAAFEHVYGLGQQFKNAGSADGDWTALGVRQGEGLLGNGFAGFQQAAVGNVQIPVAYFVGKGVNAALMMDNVYKQSWDFVANWWQARMFGDQLRFFVMAGPDLPDLRSDYMELTGRPPVPPRKAFGLWVSEFGYDGWEEVDALRDGLRAADFPVDGFVLDLNWFGGVVPGAASESEMGRLDWDQDQEPRLADNPYSFPEPGARIAAYAADHLGLVAIEESYLADTTDTFSEMPDALSSYHRTDGRCDPLRQDRPVTRVQGFWGVGRMIDWTDPEAGRWIHDNRRRPSLSGLGLIAHWTDLGEPETFDPAACYDGVEPGKADHPDVHNLYNLLWNRSIWQGYAAHQGEPNALGVTNPRPFIVTRSGAAGIQRYGAAMWSGDIAANLESLATHMNAQMHMSMSGIDYYGADIGGFRRETMPYNDKQGSYRGYQDELYTQWFANGAWFDVPVRPHTDNEFVVVTPPYATAPHLVGDLESNRANLRQRYELIPYYYSLAYRAHLEGEPVVPPLVFYHQEDPAVRRIGHEKLIGRDILVAIVARHGEYERDVYLPAGRWANYHSHEWVESDGETVADVPVYRDGLFRLPAFVRAGAILPKMQVDASTKDAFGRRRDGGIDPTLVLRVYADAAPSSFMLYEDDGTTLLYDAEARPRYHHRRTEIVQQGGRVTIAPAVDIGGTGAYPGAPSSRSVVVEMVAEDAEATAVSLDGSALPKSASPEAFAAAESGWRNAGRNLILAKSPPSDVYDRTEFVVSLAPVAPATSVSFVCDRGFTVPGESVYAIGSLPALGAWDPAAAVRLAPSVYFDYIVAPPPGHVGPGPSSPVWTGVVDDLPPETSFEWKCIRRREDGSGSPTWEAGENNRHLTTASGYSGRSYGSF